jgi:drug/metabolite transporter (DMT)-like permease
LRADEIVERLGLFALRASLALRTSPWMRALAGAILIVLGVLWIVVGAGHGRLAAVGAILLIGAVGTGVRNLRARRSGGGDC